MVLKPSLRVYRNVDKECRSRGAVGNGISPGIPNQWFGLLFSEAVTFVTGLHGGGCSSEALNPVVEVLKPDEWLFCRLRE
jgi:hypothetical protein